MIFDLKIEEVSMRGVLDCARVMMALTLLATPAIPALAGFGSCQAKRPLKVCEEFPVRWPIAERRAREAWAAAARKRAGRCCASWSHATQRSMLCYRRHASRDRKPDRLLEDEPSSSVVLRCCASARMNWDYEACPRPGAGQGTPGDSRRKR